MNEAPNPLTLRHLLQMPILIPLYLYTRYISLLLPARCRFYPSCSRYAYEAVYYHGTIKGVFLATKRLTKCHPWHEGGFDPLPAISNGCCSRHSGSTQHPPQTSSIKESLS